MAKGLLVWVWRSPRLGDCTAGGVSSKHDQFVLTGETVFGVTHPDQETPELKLVRRPRAGGEYLHAEPAHKPKGMVGPMFGGNYISSSDGRFPNAYPIPIHDRFESPKENDRQAQ
jgi:hypothetical protein